MPFPSVDMVNILWHGSVSQASWSYIIESAIIEFFEMTFTEFIEFNES